MMPDPSDTQMMCRHLKATLRLKDLSGGERIQLLCLLWRHPAMQAMPGLLLLDEPDAHLHPSLCQEFIQSLQQLVRPREGTSPIQVIMTTHNATTVRFLDDDDCKSGRLKIFKMERDAPKPAPINKRQAMQFLSQDLVSVTEPLRIVFCEAKNDVLFYHRLFQRFRSSLVSALSDGALLLFKSGVGAPDSAPQAELIRDDDIIAGSTDSNRKNVELMLAQFSGGHVPVSEFVRGIVDRDNVKPNSKLKPNPLLVSGQRYAIENYIYDPLIIARMLWIGSNQVNMKDLYVLAWNCCIKNLTPAQIESLIGVFQLQAGSVPAADAESVLQKLIDDVAEWFLDTLEGLPRVAGADGIQQRLENPTRQIRLASSELRRVRLPVPVSAWGLTLSYPAILVVMRGHDFADVWAKVIEKTVGKKADLLKQGDMAKVAFEHLPPFDDLVTMFTELQTPIPIK